MRRRAHRLDRASSRTLTTETDTIITRYGSPCRSAAAAPSSAAATNSSTFWRCTASSARAKWVAGSNFHRSGPSNRSSSSISSTARRHPPVVHRTNTACATASRRSSGSCTSALRSSSTSDQYRPTALPDCPQKGASTRFRTTASLTRPPSTSHSNMASKLSRSAAQSVGGGPLIHRVQCRHPLRCQRCEVAEMAFAPRLGGTCFRELRLSVLAHRLQQAIPGRSRRSNGCDHRLVDQSFQQIDHIERVEAPRRRPYSPPPDRTTCGTPPGDRTTRGSSSSRNSYDHSTAASNVWCRSRPPRRPPTGAGTAHRGAPRCQPASSTATVTQPTRSQAGSRPGAHRSPRGRRRGPPIRHRLAPPQPD